MIITDRFVVLSNPKTGSTFVRAALKRIHGYDDPPKGLLPLPWRFRTTRGGMSELLLPNLRAPDERPADQHGTLSQIPRAHRGKPVVSVVRDPFSRLLSAYRFQWWRRYPPGPPELLARRFPRFPELTLEEYLRLEEFDASTRLPSPPPDFRVGFQTVQFIQMFFRDPTRVLRGLDDSYLDSDRFLDDLPRIHFLQTEDLNRELHQFLLEAGYPEERVSFILKLPAANTTERPLGAAPWNQQLLAEVLRSERLLFRILRHQGFHYPSPTVAHPGA